MMQKVVIHMYSVSNLNYMYILQYVATLKSYFYTWFMNLVCIIATSSDTAT